MRASLRGREELVHNVQTALSLATKKDAEHVVNTVIHSLEATLLNNLETDGFTLKLNGLGKFSVRHRQGWKPPPSHRCVGSRSLSEHHSAPQQS